MILEKIPSRSSLSLALAAGQMAPEYLHGPVDYCKMHGQLVFAVFGSFFVLFFPLIKCAVVRQNHTSPVHPHLVEVDVWSFFSCLWKLLLI